jgi:hypothetical protein
VEVVANARPAAALVHLVAAAVAVKPAEAVRLKAADVEDNRFLAARNAQ